MHSRHAKAEGEAGGGGDASNAGLLLASVSGELCAKLRIIHGAKSDQT